MQYLLIPKLDTHWTGFQTQPVGGHRRAGCGKHNINSTRTTKSRINKPGGLPAALSASKRRQAPGFGLDASAPETSAGQPVPVGLV